MTVTEATLLVASAAVPVTFSEALVVDGGTLESIVAVGAVTSLLIVCVFVLVPPVLVAVHVTAVVPSLLMAVVVVLVAHAADRAVTAESGSITAKLTVTLPLLYQPFDPFGTDGVTVGVMTGGVVSAAAETVTVTVSEHVPEPELWFALTEMVAVPAELKVAVTLVPVVLDKETFAEALQVGARQPLPPPKTISLYDFEVPAVAVAAGGVDPSAF